MAYDPTTNIGKVRLLIPDRVEGEYAFNDAEIAVLLDIEDGSIKRAAALGLETVAADEALVQKVQKTLGLETNGAATCKALLQRAEMLRKQADKAEDESDDGSGGFAFAEMTHDEFSTVEILQNQFLRGDF